MYHSGASMGSVSPRGSFFPFLFFFHKYVFFITLCILKLLANLHLSGLGARQPSNSCLEGLAFLFGPWYDFYVFSYRTKDIWFDYKTKCVANTIACCKVFCWVVFALF